MIRFYTGRAHMNSEKSHLSPEIFDDAKSRWKTYALTAESHAAVIEADQVFFEELLQVWGFSDFISKICLRDPGMLMDLVESKHLFENIPYRFLSKKSQAPVD